MNLQAATHALRAVREQLPAALGEALISLYAFGSLTTGRYRPGSDVNLLLVLADDVPLDAVRAPFLPLWQVHGSVLRRGPALTTPAMLQRLAALAPELGHHLHQNGKRLYGAPLPPLAAAPDPRATLARDAHAALHLSGLLAPALLPPEVVAAQEAQLRDLARRLVDADPAPPRDLFLAVMDNLARRLAALAAADGDLPPVDNPPPLLPNLRAIYERADDVVLVLPAGGLATLGDTDWNGVADLVAGEYGGMRVTTVPLLRLAAGVADPLSIALRHFSHVWGHDVLSGIDVDMATIMRAAARRAGEIVVLELPGVYLTAGDDQFHTIIHDFQNKLLNLQLQHELFHRLFQLPRVEPQPPLLGRDAAPERRIEVIAAQVAWWTSFYGRRYDEAAADSPAP